MKKIVKFAQGLERKPHRVLTKIFLMIFLISFLIGFSSGLVFREFRLNLLMTKQKNQKIEEEKRFNDLFGKFPQVESFHQK